MCGLSAVFDFEPGGELLGALTRMHDQVPHRGPDGEGFAAMDDAGAVIRAKTLPEMRIRAAGSQKLSAGLAFRWLKIQDASDLGAQPVSSSDGSVCLIFNGEIYNFRALREQLRAYGHPFRSSGDAEVLAAAYLQWGAGMFPRLTGMWAIILVDTRSRTLLIARDRFGIKPLYYCWTGSRLLLASEVKQLIAAGAPPTANSTAVAGFIRGHRPESPDQTFFSHIYSQPPATYAEIRLKEPRQALAFTAYWGLPEKGERRTTLSFEGAASALDEVLTESVGDHLLGPAPTGHLISGGLDSSLVAALAARHYARDRHIGQGFSMVLGTGGASDESAFIDCVSSHLRFHSHKAEFSPGWLKANIGRISRAQEEPIAGPAAAGQFFVFELAARNGVRVILDGQGADELFAGYPRHQVTYLRDCATRLALGTLFVEGAATAIRAPRMLSRTAYSMLRRRWRGKSPDESPVAAGFLRAQLPSDQRPKTLFDALRVDVVRGNLPTVLALTDRNAMAHSIEARVPYVDHRIVEFAFALPDTHKLGLGLRKRILRKVAERYLPHQITHRADRIGFGVPITEWLRRDFRDELSSLQSESVFRHSMIVQQKVLAAFVDAFLSGRNSDAGTVWRLFAVAQWAKAYSLSAL